MRSEWNEEKLQRFLKDGRGQGKFESYVPFIQIHDFGSLGRSSRVKTWRFNRIYHLLSDAETRYFYLTEWEDEILDVREHYPLYDLQEVLGEQKDIDVNKFTDKKSGFPYILTTTFLITVKDDKGNSYDVARNIRASHELEKATTIERFELIRRYFEKINMDWGIVTQKEIAPFAIKAKNIEWVHPCRFLDETTEFTRNDITYLTNLFLERLHGNRSLIRDITSSFDSYINLETGTGLLLFKHLIATKQIKVNMNEKIDLNKPANEVVQIADVKRGGEWRHVVDG
ncbi:heteromeric transposase endonuclease subunit TnsA [Aneurinibacillus tyrosinisolvens]|uniref:heteromeric transposase endonuclease subunit TnsA n=1 Tax=Aneurinibacillus tyrosinisolvens TaxID=1443435 RepID=UPI00063F640F|nr:heteromeric transposase endonuclease subunit TnsA [Aneurinibacillus tyrosinisolvens]